jgi:trans-2,3-dihydro-3-hydroxyanthranilate isomerase
VPGDPARVSRRVRIVDVFTDRALAGNQLAVVLDAADIRPPLMQRIAREMNFSETTFVLPAENQAHAARIRIFTPVMELGFAGHPTIGTAWVLADEGLVPGGGLEFMLGENVGPVPVRGEQTEAGVMFWMTHPALSWGQVFPHAQIADALAIDQSLILASVPAQIASTGTPFLYVALKDQAAVDSATPDVGRVSKLVRGAGHGIFLFAVTGRNRLYSRMFGEDVAEDAATGSAGGPLGAFAVRYGLLERAPQVSAVSEQGVKMGRPSTVHVRLTYGNDEHVPERIEVGGFVMPVLSGTLADFS